MLPIYILIQNQNSSQMKPYKGISEPVPVSAAVPGLSGHASVCVMMGQYLTSRHQGTPFQPTCWKIRIQLEEWLCVLTGSWLWQGEHVLRLWSSGTEVYDSQDLSLAVLIASFTSFRRHSS